MNNNLLIIILFILLISCGKTVNSKKNEELGTRQTSFEVDIPKEKEKEKKMCSIPQGILKYFNNNPSTWTLVSYDEINLTASSISNKKEKCLISLQGDFNNNEEEDFAVIARKKDYKIEGYGDHSFPYLLIFNDYKKQKKQNPYVILKSNNQVNTIIYDQFDQGIITYLDNKKQCDNELIEVVLPEKSSYMVFWDTSQDDYNYLNSIDFDCDKITNENNGSVISKHWYGDFEGSFLRLKGESGDPRGWASVNISISKNSTIFKLMSYVEEEEHLIVPFEKNNTLSLLYKEPSKHNKNDHSIIGKIDYQNKKYFLDSLSGTGRIELKKVKK